MEREDKESAAIPEEKAGEPSAILPMTPESKQLAAVIATAVATAMAGKLASRSPSVLLGIDILAAYPTTG